LIKDSLGEKEPRFDDVRNASPTQIANNTKIRRFTVRMASSGEISGELLYRFLPGPWNFVQKAL
jgi:hypothetical protein